LPEAFALRWGRFAISREGRAIVRGERLEIGEGERALLTGPSGTGKSTLALAIAGLAGRELPDLELTGDAPRPSRVALVQQDPYSQAFAPNARREIAFAMENAGISREAMSGKVEESLERFGLAHIADRAPWTLSGGEAQRLSLAAALSPDPRLVALDEPLGYLDEASAARFLESMRADGRARSWLVIDHDLAPWLDWADRWYSLDEEGALVERPIREARELAQGSERAFAPGIRPDRAFAAYEAPRGKPIGRAIAVDGLRAGYGKYPDAFSPLSFAIAAGETAALAGPNGAGKTTLLKCLAGGLAARGGRVSIDGRPARSRRELARAFSWVPQVSEHFFAFASAREEWRGGRIEGQHDRAIVADEIAARFGLARLAEAHPFTLSEGQKRRLALAAALADRRGALLLDEPQFGLDAKARAELERCLSGAKAAGVTCLLVSHDSRFVARVADREILMRPDGRATGNAEAS
jgi:energy-coupling factor transport system ATP-binding protein